MLELITKVPADMEADEVLTLPFELRQRSRQRVRLDSGLEAALLLPPGTTLDDGDRLRSTEGRTVRVRAAEEDVVLARTPDPLQLARACYHLGNRHIALQVGPGWLRFQPDHVLEEMLRGLGLEVVREFACFEPERGAYHAQPHSHHGDGEPGHHH